MRTSLFRVLPAVAILGCLLALSVIPVHAQSPLERQRREPTALQRTIHPLNGRVVAEENGVIYTNITNHSVSAGITEGIALRVYLARRVFNARFLSPANFARIVTDPEARKGLDVDLVCTLDPNQNFVVVGLAGGLSEWLNVKPGAPISLERK